MAGSLITNQVRAYDLLRMFGREGHPTPLGAALAEYGRIDGTMHLLDRVDPADDTYRRLMNRQLTVQESRHRLAPRGCHPACCDAFAAGRHTTSGALSWAGSLDAG